MLQVVGKQGNHSRRRKITGRAGIGEYTAADLPGQFELGVRIHQVRRLEHQGLAGRALQFPGDAVECVLAAAKLPAIDNDHLFRRRAGFLVYHFRHVELACTARAYNRYRHIQAGQEHGLVDGALHIVANITIDPVINGLPNRYLRRRLRASRPPPVRQCGEFRRQVMQRRRIRREPRLAGSARCAVLQHHITQCALIKSQRIDRAGAVGGADSIDRSQLLGSRLVRELPYPPGQLLFARGSRTALPGQAARDIVIAVIVVAPVNRRGGHPPLTQRERNYRGQVIVGMLWVCRQPDQPSEIGLRFAPGEPLTEYPLGAVDTGAGQRLVRFGCRYQLAAIRTLQAQQGIVCGEQGRQRGLTLARMRQANTDFCPLRQHRGQV